MGQRSIHGLPPDPPTVARVLHGLPGFAWLDSSDGSDRWGGDLLAACPRSVEHGRLPAAWPEDPPEGTVRIGSIDYEGDWTFGLYDRWLRFDRASSSWSGSPGLAAEFRRAWKARRHGNSEIPPPPVVGALRTEMTEADFIERVRAAREFIAAGDIYQVNLSQRFLLDWPPAADAFAAYRRLRVLSPVPHAAFLDQGRRVVLCASPESFLVREGDRLLTRPIKGTRPRRADRREDEMMHSDLLDSAKERAELIMITDLGRNDLGRVARTGSVRVSSLCQVESFAQVHHLVSEIEAVLRPGLGWSEVMRACFPGGSITGAPKKRACEIIAGLEPGARRLFTGAIGWLGPSGRGVFNIAIRTAWIEDEQAVFAAGSGIVADSDPHAEYLETLHKARALSLALGGPDLVES